MIELKNITFSYGENSEISSVQNFNLSIKKGEFVLLCGPSGCGKTTITRLINGLIPNYYEGDLQGEAYINKKPIKEMSLFDISLKVGSVFQNPRSQFFNVDTTSEIAFGCENHGISENIIRERMNETINFFKIEELMSKNIFNLSGGEKQKIACASIYATMPEVFVLDEPSANLDVKSIEDLKRILKKLKDAGKTIIISEHRLYFLTELVDRVIYMKDGKINREFKPFELLQLKENDRVEMGLRAISKNYIDVDSNVKKKTVEKILKCEELMFSYKDKEAIKIKYTDIPIGEVVAIIGHNGAGKSTFIRCLCGLEKKCLGKIKYDNKLLKPKDRLKKSYLVMQDTNHQLFTESVEEEIMLGKKDGNKEESDEILKSLDLISLKDRHPLSLSGGQKQRVAIAGALALEKDMIILDEPTSGLDYIQMNNVSLVINKLKKRAKIIAIVTHDIEFILKCCTYVIHMEKGKVINSYYLDNDGMHQLKKFFM